MADLRFNLARTFDKSWANSLTERKTAFARKAAQPFIDSAMRVESLAGLAPVLVGHSYWRALQVALASHQVFGHPIPTPADTTEKQQLLADTMKRIDAARVIPVPSELFVNKTIDGLIGSGVEELNRGFQAILASQLLGAWTAFESLAADMWVAAVNDRPLSLAVNVLNAQDPLPAEEAASRGDRQQEAVIPFAVLRRHNFNVSSLMGDLLKERRRVSLMSLDGIQAAYLAAFRTPPGKKDARPSVNLGALFRSNYSRLRTLEAMRNVLAHKGGVIDQKFRDDVRPHDETLAEAPDGQLPLTGEIVRDHTSAAFSAGTALLEFVDGWFASMPE